MPELPDITLYQEALERRVAGTKLERIRFANPFLLRTVDPKPEEFFQHTVTGVGRMGKRIVLVLEDELFLVLHLMIAGRLHWRAPSAKIPGKVGHAAFDFAAGTVLLTEAGTHKRASLYCLRGTENLRRHNPGGIEPLECTAEEFRRALMKENHTLKRSLTDPRLLSGIGNSYSDEILHHAKLSPMKQTHRLTDTEITRLHRSVHHVLQFWLEKLREETGEAFPEHVTAFREGMSVHGRFRQPCPVCGTKIQRIAYTQNECNYCPRCQTEGKLLADRAFSRLLKEDWPKTIQELEERQAEYRSNKNEGG